MLRAQLICNCAREEVERAALKALDDAFWCTGWLLHEKLSYINRHACKFGFSNVLKLILDFAVLVLNVSLSCFCF